jgi:arginyl-tRNA synthetase
MRAARRARMCATRSVAAASPRNAHINPPPPGQCKIGADRVSCCRSPMHEFVERIRAAIARHSGLAPAAVKIESPRDPTHGDLAFPCFQLARAQRQPPNAAAIKLAQAIAGELGRIAVVAAGPYVNFRLERAALARSVLVGIEHLGSQYGRSEEGAGKTVVLDYSSPNIAKPFHVGHLRSTILGTAIKRLHEALGYRAVGINHLGDWGSQFGKLVHQLRSSGIAVEELSFADLLPLYVEANNRADADPEFAAQAARVFLELERGDPRTRAEWQRLRDLSLEEFRKIYRRLGVSFDHDRGEAFYEPYLDSTIERIVASGVTRESDGALIVELDGIEKGMAPCLLRKSDGATLYATRDLAALFHRWDEFHFERCLYVVGADQRLHFRQLKAVLERMALDWAPRVEHVDFGMLRLPEGRMTARKGRVIFLEELLDSAVERVRAIIAEKNPELADSERVAEEVGIGAVVFHDLKKERVKDVVFDWDEVLSFEGETGPYVQYTHARLASILRKASPTEAKPDWALLEDAAAILLALGRYPEVLASAARHCEPSELAQYLLALCRSISSWLTEHRVLSEEPALRAARLALVRAARITLENGLTLLGVAAPPEM